MAEQQEDLNAFDSADSAGAVLMLGIIPVAACYVFFEEQPWLMVLFGAVAVGSSVFVYLLSTLTGWRIIGTVVNLIGCILVPAYIAAAIWLWCSPYAPTARFNKNLEEQPPAASQTEAPAPAPAGN